MVQQESRLKVADNTGAKELTLHQSYGRLYKKICTDWRYHCCFC